MKELTLLRDAGEILLKGDHDFPRQIGLNECYLRDHYGDQKHTAKS